MKTTCLLVLASLVVCIVTVCGGQSVRDEDQADRPTADILLRRAKGLLLRSVLQKMHDERNEGSSSHTEWVTKRQHPGKRHSDDVEKRQHPGRREEDSEEQLPDLQRRQHPGRREEDWDEQLPDLQRRQHPGKRAAVGRVPDPSIVFLSELSKRQHPGKRQLQLQLQLQDEDEDADADGDWDWDADADGDEDLNEVEKRQHPGKRFWLNSRPDVGADSPCDVSNPASCSKTSLLLDFLDNINKSRPEEKRQHPGKRFAAGQDLVEGE